MGRSQSRALELFEKAAVTAAGNTRILREVVTALAEVDLIKPAQTYLGRFPPNTQGGPDYLAMDLLVIHKSGMLGRAIERGREILSKGVEDPLIYQTLIRASAEAGFVPAAEALVSKAQAKYPEQKQAFAEALSGAQLKTGDEHRKTASKA